MSIFGQNPADITGALFKAKNLADVPDKAAARTALDVPSKAEVQYNSVPVGMILPFWGSVAPLGYVPCSGQTVTSGSFPELVTFLGGTTSAVVPDLRGEFLRGWDNGRGVDVGRAISTFQADELKSHFHTTNNVANSGSDPTLWVWGDAGTGALTPPSVQTNATGGSETRPRNVSVLYCIKAYSSVTNFTSGVNIAGLVNDYSTLSSAAVKYADFLGSNQSTSTNGWQKLPGGIIIQWGRATTSAGVGAVVFPIIFPNSVFTITATYGGSSSATAPILCSYGAATVSGFTPYLSATSNSSGANSTGGYIWTAIGY